MDKTIVRIVPESEFRYALMGFGYDPYRVVSITSILGTHNYRLVLELKENDGREDNTQ